MKMSLSMTKKLLLWMLVANICLAQAISLTKEIVPDNVAEEELKVKSQAATFSEILDKITKANLVDDIFNSFFQNHNQTILAVIEIIKTNKSDLQGIFDIFNQGCGAKLLKVDGELLKVDSAQIELFAKTQVRSLSKALFPKDVYRQLMFYAFITEQVRATINSAAPDLKKIAVPLDDISNILKSLPSQHAIAKRDTNSDMFTLIFTLFRSQICSALSNVYSVTKSTLSIVVSNLNNVLIDTSSTTNALINILANIFNTVIGFINNLIARGLELFESVYTSVNSSACSTSSRKRRDTDLVLADELQPRALIESAFSIIVAVIGFIYKYTIGAVISTLAKSFVAQVLTTIQGVIDTFLNTTILNFFTSFINSVTLQT